MKTKKLFPFVTGMLMLATMTISCSKAEESEGDILTTSDLSGLAFSGLKSGDGGEGGPGESGSQGGNTQAGIVTAGEWSDLKNWSFWSGLMLAGDYAEKSDYWSFFTNNRIAIKVTDKSGQLVAGVPVKLLRKSGKHESTVWETVTDNHGLAECWVGLYQKETVNSNSLSVSIDGQVMKQEPVICSWDSLQQQQPINNYVITPKTTVKSCADIAFVVDATGSMGDEIEFLKNDLVDIIGKASAVRPSVTMRTPQRYYAYGCPILPR